MASFIRNLISRAKSPLRSKQRLRKCRLNVEQLEVRNLLDFGGISSISPGMVGITSITPDTGESNTDLLTNATQLTANGQGTPGEDFQLLVDGVLDSTDTVGADGTWQVPLSHQLSEGTHQIMVQNVPGAMYTFGGGLSVLIDTTPPEVSLTAPEFVKGTQTTVTVQISNSDSYPLAPTVSIDLDTNSDGDFNDPGESNFATTYGSFPGTYQINLANLPEGIFNIRARVNDYAGNTGTSAVLQMQVDPNAGIVGSDWLLKVYHDYTGSTTTDGGYSSSSDGMSDPTYSGGTDPTYDGSSGGSGGMSLADLSQKYNFLRWDDQYRVGVNVRATLTKYVDTLKQQLEGMGMQVTYVAKSQNLITGYLPVDQIMALENLDAFSAVTAAYKPRTAAGLVPGQGDPVIKGDTFKTSTGATGQGIKVGVLSDSINQVGNGVADSQATGDLPASGVQILQDYTGSGATDEGRAMSEIVHDVAPGSDLAFHTAFISEQNFASGITALAGAGSRVITDDVGYADEPMFNDGVIAQAVDSVTTNGVVYTSAAGNDANVAWMADWTGLANQTIGSGTSQVTGTFFTFGGNDILQDFSLPGNGVLVLSFQWDDAYLENGSPNPNYQVNTDMDVYITNTAGSTIMQSYTTNNPNTDQALEFVVYSNSSANPVNLAMAFRLTSGPAPTKLRWVNFGGDDPNAQNEGGSTIFGHPVAKGAIATAAVPFYSPTTPEPFTALGGNLPILFDSNGNRLASPDIRTKPEVAAPDGVNTTFFGQDIPQDTDGYPNFFGTSAATPHVAGAVALLLSQANYTPTPAEVTKHLEETALDINSSGYDFLTGYGLIQLEPLPAKGPNITLPSVYDYNDTSDQATNLGTLSADFTQTGLAIAVHPNGLYDYDWYKFTAGTSGTVTVSLNNIQTLNGGDLHLRIFKLVNGTLVDLGSSTLTGGVSTQAVTFAAEAGAEYFVWVYGFNFEQGLYDMDIKFS